MIFLHISNRPEIPLTSILKSIVDTFVSFLKRGNYIISLCNENIVVLRFINDNSKKEKKENVTR